VNLSALAVAERLRRRRMTRSLAVLHNSQSLIASPIVRADLERLLLAGKSMDFAARLHEHDVLTGEQANRYAALAGIGRDELRIRVLPALASAGIIDYEYANDSLARVEEFIGVSGSLLEQAASMLDNLNPTQSERATLQSISVASWAPLARAQHLQALTVRGFSDEQAEAGLSYAAAAGVNELMPSPELREDVVFNAQVWGSGVIPIAQFLKHLPVDQREVLLGIAEEASSRPGIALASLGTPTDDTMVAARRVGLLQTATVRSTSGGQIGQTYAFAPLIASEDDLLVTTESLHGRKLFVAHMLFAHERARAGLGRVRDPMVLVRALVRDGEVGPATNIGTDYHLLEAAGIVAVDDSGARPFLRLIKREIAEGGLLWLTKAYGDGIGRAESELLAGLRPPGEFASPELDRARATAGTAAMELTQAAVMHLRKEAQRVTRGEVWA
jgi:hypothetical protein